MCLVSVYVRSGLGTGHLLVWTTTWPAAVMYCADNYLSQYETFSSVHLGPWKSTHHWSCDILKRVAALQLNYNALFFYLLKNTVGALWIVLNAIWSAIGMIMLSVCPSVTLCIVAKRYILRAAKVSEEVNRKCHRHNWTRLYNVYYTIPYRVHQSSALKLSTRRISKLITISTSGIDLSWSTQQSHHARSPCRYSRARSTIGFLNNSWVYSFH